MAMLIDNTFITVHLVIKPVVDEAYEHYIYIFIYRVKGQITPPILNFSRTCDLHSRCGEL
jgi:hypothetical protein